MIGGDLIAGVELGGTKAVALLAHGRAVVARSRFPTTTPDETLAMLRRQLAEWQARYGFAALGIASFGPIRLNPEAPDYGCMLATPKPGWSGAQVAQTLAGGLNCPWQIDTDVNAAALAEWCWGAGQGLNSLCYLTIGTGVGGGILQGGRPLHGALHPEVGHMRLRRAPGDKFIGTCPFHGDCIEGLISGPALQARFGVAGEQVAESDPSWAFVAHDLAELIGALALTISPQKVLVGGGIGMGRSFLLDLVREQFVEALGGYLPHLTRTEAQTFIMHPALGGDSGPLGAISLGQVAFDNNRIEIEKGACS
jgi:fructokinase